MDKIDELAQRMDSLSTGSTSLFDVLDQMNATSQAESGLDMRSWLMVRLAAMAASDASADSYRLLLTLGEDEGFTAADVAGVLVAVAPTIGGSRAIAAAERILEVFEALDSEGD